MYEEISIKRKIDWKSVFIKSGILIVLVFIICAISFAPKKTYAVTPLNGINKDLLEAGKKHYNNDLPTKIGHTKSITLMNLVELDLIKAKNYNSNNCNFNESYVKVAKVNNKEFSISSHLLCGDKNDVIVDTIIIKKDNQVKNDTTVNNTNDFEIGVIE